MAFIEVDNISYSYPNSSFLSIDGISLKVERGEFLSILGPNGSGKSTLSLILAGLIKESSGSIVVDGKSDILSRRDKIRVVFQNPDNQIIGETVEEDVAFGPENLTLGQNEIRERVDRALKECRLYDKRGCNPLNLSGGEKQRLALSSILALEPECIIFDEASSMLDENDRKSILSLAIKEVKENGRTVIYITHHTDEILASDRVLIFDGGKIIKDGNVKETLTYSLLKEHNLPLPYYLDLSHRLKLKECLTQDELVEEIVKRSHKQ